MIISICGNICSGKSTTAKVIEKSMNFTYIPYERPELEVLDEFYDNICELFFVTQSYFLLNKSQQILDTSKKNLVIDRSIYEDINIFARYWMSNYPIRKVDKNAYLQLTKLILSVVPKSDIEIFCACSTPQLLDRFDSRPRRSFEKKYPSNYIKNLNEIYNDDCYFKRCFRLDMDKYDIRHKDMQFLLIEDINLIAKGYYSKLRILEYQEDDD